MPGNKHGIRLAGFVFPGISNNRSLAKYFSRAVYHCAIWVDSKNSKGEGRFYHMEERPRMSSAAGLVSGNWNLVLDDFDHWSNMRLVGRIKIGELPPGKGLGEIEALLRHVPVPVERSREHCNAWTADAIRLLQRQRPTPWAEEFDVEKFMNDAHSLFNVTGFPFARRM